MEFGHKEATWRDIDLIVTPRELKDISTTEVVIEVTEDNIDEISREEAIEKHIEMFGKKPHHKMSTENIIKKLI